MLLVQDGSTAATVGVILSAAYMLWMVQRIFYGPTSSLVSGKLTPDLRLREAIALWPMAVLMLVMGVASPYWIRAINDSVIGLVKSVERTSPYLTSPVAVKINTTGSSVAEKR